MTTPITEQPTHQQVTTPPVGVRAWCCGTPITGPHTPGCVDEPRADAPVDYSALTPDAAPEPPPTPTVVPAAARPRSYGFAKADEHDLELPSGSLVRYRKLTPSHLLKLNLVEVLDGFTPELLADIRSEDPDTANDAALKALTDPERNGKIFGPIDRVLAVAVIIPTVVLAGPTTDTQVNVDDVDLEDKIAIFDAAIGEQLAALKSVRSETVSGV